MNIEPIPAAGLLATTLVYVAGMRRLRAKGRSWSWKRWVPYFAGVLCIGIATESPLASLDTKDFAHHVDQHLLLSMAGPALLCMGAPLTLWLQAASRPAQVRLLSILHSRIVRFITFPVVSWCIFVFTLYILYFSPLYELSLRNSVFHDFVHIHFILAGFIFFAPVVAIDPHPHRVPHGARLLYVALTLPAHAFLALALLTASIPLAHGFYLETTGRTLDQILSNQKLGAAIMWVASDMVAIFTVGVVANQWYADDQRVSAREDRELELQERMQNA
jgi:cytochrome c oxidase assembly factor CtaG